MRFQFAMPVAFAAAALLLAGCSGENGALPTTAQSTVTPAASTSTPAPAASFRPFNPVVQLFYGLGSLALPCKGCSGVAAENGVQRFLFDVVVHKDGTVDGGAEYSANVGGGLSRSGTALCVGNIGDGVWALAFTLTKSTGAAPTGSILPPPTTTDDVFLFAFKDNDQGFRRSGPDEITGVIHTTAFYAKLACSNPAALGFTSTVVENAFLNNLKAGLVEVIPQ